MRSSVDCKSRALRFEARVSRTATRLKTAAGASAIEVGNSRKSAVPVLRGVARAETTRGRPIADDLRRARMDGTGRDGRSRMAPRVPRRIPMTVTNFAGRRPHYQAVERSFVRRREQAHLGATFTATCAVTPQRHKQNLSLQVTRKSTATIELSKSCRDRASSGSTRRMWDPAESRLWRITLRSARERSDHRSRLRVECDDVARRGWTSS